MRTAMQTLPMAILLILSMAAADAQSTVDPSGHWEGSVQGMARFELDLMKGRQGQLAGTFNMPDENLKGLPLVRISLEGEAISFAARADQGFEGAVSADGKSITGNYNVEGFSIPFTLARTGAARNEAPPPSPAITSELEGTWNGTLAADGASLRVALILKNEPDGTATGKFVNLDQGGLTIPLVIVQQGANVTLDAKAIGGGYSGRLNPGNSELVGTYSQNGRSVPLTFKRAAGKKD